MIPVYPTGSGAGRRGTLRVTEQLRVRSNPKG